MNATDIALAISAAVMLAGAVATVIATDVIRLVIALGAFLIGVALAFLSLGSPILAASEVLAYVGGVLVLVLFALMLVGRSSDERPRAVVRHDIGAAVTSLLVFFLLSWALVPDPGMLTPKPVDPGAVAEHLLGAGLPAFELVGLLLLLALLAVLVIVKGGEDG